MEKGQPGIRHSLFPEQRRTVLPGGYMGKVLRINLSHGQIKEENLPEEEVLRKYPGGQALGQLVLMHELPQGVAPLSPENIMVFMTGPLTGTGKTPAGGGYVDTTLSNVTPYVVSAFSSGYWGAYLKFSGYDGIILNGAADSPVYLWINNGKVEIRDASKLWGKDSHETEELVRREVGQPHASVVTIGPAGENGVRGAMLLNDANHSAAHGSGAVMGAKKVKAIAAYGTNRVPVRDGEALVDAGNRWREKLKPYSYPRDRHGPGYGHMLKGLINRNWQTTLHPTAARDFDENEYIPRPCYQCYRSCPYDVRITTGKHAGYVASPNGGSENLEGSSFALGVGGPDVHYLVDIIDRAGIDACQFGCSAGVVFEAYEKGLINTKETDGLELKWGDADVVEKLIWKMARREGPLGNLLAEGPKAVAEKLGGEAARLVVHVKGGAPAMHDWRPYASIMLGQIISSGGVKPQFNGAEINPIPDLGYPEKTNPQTMEGKARETFLGGVNKLFCGCAVICWFGVPFGRPGIMKDVADAMAATTGWQGFSMEETLVIGERAWQMEHLLHLQHGWTPQEDLKNIGPRFLEPVPDGPFQGFAFAKFLPDLVNDFYRQCGWDVETGKPTEATLKRLGMEEFASLP
jgi:aldehyde:ferredoxin oxidoreductase